MQRRSKWFDCVRFFRIIQISERGNISQAGFTYLLCCVVLVLLISTLYDYTSSVVSITFNCGDKRGY